MIVPHENQRGGRKALYPAWYQSVVADRLSLNRYSSQFWYIPPYIPSIGQLLITPSHRYMYTVHLFITVCYLYSALYTVQCTVVIVVNNPSYLYCIYILNCTVLWRDEYMLSLLLWIRLVFCTYNSTVQYLYSIKLCIINTVVYCIPHRRFFTVIYTV